MSHRLRAAVMVGLVAAFGLGATTAASALVPSDDCVEDVMDLPALNVCKDAEGRHILQLPAIGELREPAPPTPEPAATPAGALPKTGLATEDFAALGLAALAGGAVLLRRLRLAVS